MSDLFMQTNDSFIGGFLPAFFFLSIIKFLCVVNSFVDFFKFCAVFLEPWGTCFLLRRTRNWLLHLGSCYLGILRNLISIYNAECSTLFTWVVVGCILVRLLLLLELLGLMNRFTNLLL